MKLPYSDPAGLRAQVKTSLEKSNRSRSAVHENRNLALREHFLGFAAEIAEMSRRPCEAITLRSQPFDRAVSMMAW